MNNEAVVVLAGHNTLVNSRIKNVFSGYSIKTYEVYNRRELFRILSQTKNNVDLILTEIEIDPKNGFNGVDLIQQVKAKRSGIPVVVLSSVCKKEVITQCLYKGASDYILKPFKNEYLMERLIKYIDIEKSTESTVLQFNLKDFLGSEIHKARKGQYCFSLLKIQFDSIEEKDTATSDHCFYHYEQAVYEEMKSLFWESDLYIQHGYQCHLGFFPFCDQNNKNIILGKIESQFENFKLREPNIRNYSIAYTFASYPKDGETASELLRSLSVDTTVDQESA